MKKELGPTGMYHSGPDNKSVGNGRNGVTAMQGGEIMKKLFDPMKDIKQIQQNIRENIQYPKYGDDDSSFIEGKDEGEFTMYKAKPPYRLKTKELTTDKTYYQGEEENNTKN